MMRPQAGDSPDQFCTDFAGELRRRRVSVRQAASMTHWGKSTIANACHGPRLPQRKLVSDVLAALDVETATVDDWLDRYDALERGTSLRDAPTDGASQASGWFRARWFRHPLLVLGATAAVVTLASAAVLLWVGLTSASATVVVANKVAFRTDKYEEDVTPAYLSSRPVEKCSQRGCKLRGTDMWSGFTLTVTCHLRGDQMTNFDTTSAGYGQNPNAYYSSEWYRATWPDGRMGYISYIYVADAYRSGMDLPAC